MNAVTDIADLEAEPLDEGMGRAEARAHGVARAGGVGLILLDRVEALAVKAARLVKAQALDDALDLTAVAAAKDLAAAYGKVSRSIRQNAMLEDRLEAGLAGRGAALASARRDWTAARAKAEADRAAAAEAAAWEATHGPRLAREIIVTDLMERIIFARDEEAHVAESLETEFAELLEEGAGFEAYGDRPVSETVGRLCAALKIEPDWDDFAHEDWARDEAKAGVAGSPYVSRERGGTGACVLSVRGLQGAGLADVEALAPGVTDSS